MEFHCLIHLFCRDVNYCRHTTFWSPCVHLHQEHINDSIKACTCAYRILNLNTLRTVDSIHVYHDIVEVALIRVQLVDKENDWLMKFLGITEVVLCTNLRTILTVNKDNSLIGYVESRDCTTDKVVRTWAIDNVEFLVVPLYMEHCGEHRVAILMFYREVVAYRVLCFHRTTALDNTTTINHRLGKGGLAATRTA
ncbi:putative 66.3 kDa protein in hag2 5'region [Leyella stercorea CAG:629]|uniref:Putative 66.3 kDa protein in hag2 5'region n=1 Tax=Leyella stercorea CAG:629 TaxID=1263103 RepID=R7GZQ2_9BACT|nr:putative 66.3 kDa protein in hag2 5'region [Leyella stercorea CAG:629]